MTDFLLLAFIFLIAGITAVPIATKLGLGSVLGYLIAGIAISPVLILLHVDVVSIQHFAEFGVVMMLFLVGLELEPKLLWETDWPWWYSGRWHYPDCNDYCHVIWSTCDGFSGNWSGIFFVIYCHCFADT